MLSTVRDACAGCGGALEPVLDLGSSPLADRFPLPGEAERWYPLRVAVCTACWLLQLLDVVDGAELYGDGYGFLTGASPSSQAYFAAAAAGLLAAHPDLPGRLVVEIACNDGTLLRHFAAAGCRVLGVEPAAPAAEQARARGLEVAVEPFTAAAGARIGGDARLVLAFNVAAHVADPLDFLAGIRKLLAPDGVAVVEFQSVADLIAGCQFDHVYHEHRFFYSVSSFAGLAAAAGLRVLDWEHVPAQGGSMRVTLARGALSGLPRVPGEEWLRGPAAYAGLQDRACYARDRLAGLLGGQSAAGRVTAGYGATAKSATLLNFCGIGPGLVPWVEDVTPSKIGRETPGSRIPIVKPGDRGTPDAYLLLAWNYAGDILRRERDFTGGGGRFIVPGPVPVIL